MHGWRLGISTVCLLILSSGVLSGAPQPAQAEKPPGLRVLKHLECESASMRTTVRLECDDRVSYTCSSVAEDPSRGLPARVYCDLSNTVLTKGVARSTPLQEGPVRAVRVGQFDQRTVRVVFDLRTLAEHEVTTAASPFRVVVSLRAAEKSIPPARSSSADKETRKEPEAAAPAPPADSATQAKKVAADSAPADRPDARRYKPRIVIDPGHGGDDPGAIGPSGLMEKDVTLRLARMLKARLNQSGNPNVFLTRSRDIYVSLKKRTAIANAKKADLFVSIHVNGHNDGSVSGIETYYLDNTTDKAAIRLAAFENASVDRSATDVQRILIALRRNSNVLESNALAHTIQESLVARLSRTFRGVSDNGAKANLFYVLLGAEMPSVLIEVSYITNTMEESRLRDERYLQAAAEGISDGLVRYISSQYLPTIQAMR